MKTMTKISVAVVIVVGAVVAAIAAGVFSTKPAANGLDDFLTYVPADSPLVMVGQTDEANMAASDAMLRNMNPNDLRPILNRLEQSEEGTGPRLVKWLLDDYIQTAVSGGYEAVAERYGLSFTQPYGLYVNGAAPVFRFSLTSPEPMKAVLAEAQAATGVSAREGTLGSGTLYAWGLDENKPELELGVVLDETSLTLSVLTGSDSTESQMLRFARQPAAQSLAGSERLKELRAEYAEANQFMGFVDIHRLAEALLLPEKNSTGRELRQWFPELDQKIGADLTDACRNDYVALAGHMPRITMGAEEYDVSSELIQQTLGFLWKIENKPVLTSLQKLQGFVPGYATKVDDKLGAYAMGVNVSQLVPVLTELWTQFTQATFACEQLQQMQQQAKSYNPAMLAMGTAMFESVRGAGVAVYNLEPSDQTPMGLDGSVLISVSSENPAALASMLTSYLPQFGGMTIPTDGTPVEVPDPMGLGGNYLAIKGKHLVAYRGEAAQAAADELGGEALEVNGTAALSLNLREPMELFELVQPMAAQPGNAGCAELYVGMLSLTQTPMSLVYSEELSDRGWAGSLAMEMEVIAPLEASTLAGTYELSMLDNTDCQWYPLGTETLNEDGSGSFASQNDSGECETYQSEFSWTLNGRQLAEATSVEREREACDGDWSETVEDAEDFECGIVAPEEEGFYCTSQSDGMIEMYRYRKQ
ncbi:hypothetical protein [Marinimicrobium locisalis]|uniref:hypothetical protein n=1 Tax=Marinimicrobium locisalis TaxID=546022 RepID=UPI003221D526